MIFTLRRLRVFLLGLLLVIVGVFLWLKVVPGGEITYQRVWPNLWRSGQGFIQSLTPAERVDLTGSRPKLIGDPVYFSVFTPRTFNKARLTIVYSDHLTNNTPVVEIGVLMDKLVWRYDLQPIQNKILDQLFLESGKLVKETGLTLWQATSQYDNLGEFQKDLEFGRLKDCPDGPQKCLAVYNYAANTINNNLAARSANSDDSKNKSVSQQTAVQPVVSDYFIMNQPLRGPHQFYLDIKKTSFDLDIKLADLNQDQAADPIEINLYYNNKLVKSQNLIDPNLQPTGAQVELKSITLTARDLTPGIYKVEIKTSQDVVIKEIKNSAGQPSFINRVWPVSAPGTLNLYTDADYLQVKAFNPASLGEISFAGQNFSVDAAYDQFNFVSSSTGSLNRIMLDHDDLILENDGVFSWSATDLVNPALKQVGRYLNNLATWKYILAAYTPSLTQGEFKAATVEFDIQKAYREKGKYSFIISIPGLRATGSAGAYLEIKEIKLELSGRTLWQKLFDKGI